MPYSHYQHRHNFAVWCAARAVQRNFANANTLILKEALENSGVVAFIKDNEENDISKTHFDEQHERWCNSILKTWNNIDGASYGRAAKLVAVYIKAMIVVRNGQSKLAIVAHPPIDRIILKNISRDSRIHHDNRENWKEINWTKLDKEKYKKLIKDFRQVVNNQPFWVIEKYWSITNK